MTRLQRFAAPMLGALGALGLAGCIEERREIPNGDPRARRNVRYVNGSDDDEGNRPEDALLEHAEAHPDDPQGWWALGEYYESRSRFIEASAAYTRLAAVTNAWAQANPIVDDKGQTTIPKFTCGDYHLGRVYAKTRDYRLAVEHLRNVLAIQPQDPRDASVNAHFRESHFILGAIYYDNRQWSHAREQFEAFKLLGGEPERADPWIMRMDEQEYLVAHPRRDVRRAPPSAPPSTPTPPGARRPAVATEQQPAAGTPGQIPPSTSTPQGD